MKKNISIILIWSFWIFMALMLTRIYNTPDYKLPYPVKKLSMSMFPQGWGFFTRNPQEGITEAYAIENNTLKNITIKNASAQNLFGFSRNARFVSIDVAILLEYLPEDKWTSGKGDFKDHLPKETVKIEVDRSIQHFPDGEYLIYRYEPISFLWAGKNQEHYRPYRVMRIALKYTKPDPS
ncbi:SdpA family antimicrobial peptide system protein [Fulvivirga maritima]|uniref:SdpA family antimicrobial peptide system protein n=1 Tax=Fulvivirga maritima TaxID=2904247 RepID=UPI001F2F5B92|nr:SdpA family antimicrobial peptide system protein [Fulvivirga maritima]UII26200.1 SdpA family antimicrobial peptide system protein [Fulvivirga maritima]